MRRYSAYGLVLETDHRFHFNVSDVSDVLGADLDSAPVLHFSVVGSPPLGTALDAQRPVFTTAQAGSNQPAGLEAFELGEAKVLRFLDVCDFYLFPAENRIVCHLRDDSYLFAVDIWLLGTVMALWLELAGCPVLHASAVNVAGSGVGFLATSKGGKSSLAATLMARGHTLLSDDNLALRRDGDRWLALPSYAQMRMWPEQAEHFLGTADGLGRVQPTVPKLKVPVGRGGFGEMSASPVPLRALYLPERTPGLQAVETESVPLAEAVIELVRNTFLFELVEALGLTAARFTAFGEVAGTVPVLRLRYPEGLDRLPEVVATLEP